MSQLILVAPAAFKGTLGPRQVADALAAGARQALPDATGLQCPISDGGDGLLDPLLAPAPFRDPPRATLPPRHPPPRARRSVAGEARGPWSGRRRGAGPGGGSPSRGASGAWPS